MQLTLKVERLNEQPYEVKTNLQVIVAWERRFKSKASALANGVGMEDLAYMAYEASRIAGEVVPATLDAFIASIVNLEIVDGEPARPTDAGL
jgi:hypothetical protein